MRPALALVLTVPVSECELASDALWALGVAAVEERIVDDAFVELWTSLGDDSVAVTREAEAFPTRWRWRVVELDPSVADSWRRHATPTWIERDLVVVPAWIDADVAAGTIRLDVDPGAAFGLGDHPTTMLSARLLRAAWWPGATVLDVGTGSGVLAVLALAAPEPVLVVHAGELAARLENSAGRADLAGRRLPPLAGLRTLGRGRKEQVREPPAGRCLHPVLSDRLQTFQLHG